MWQTAPKKSIETMKAIAIVEVIKTANFWKVIIEANDKKNPAPKVVILPLRILAPISV